MTFLMVNGQNRMEWKKKKKKKAFTGGGGGGQAQPMPSHCPPDGKSQPQWHLQPTVTATNRFGNLLQPLLRPPRSLPF